MQPSSITGLPLSAVSGVGSAHEVDMNAGRSRAINDLVHHMDVRLGECLAGAGPVGHRADDVMGRLAANAAVLHDAGIDTPEKLDHWMNACWHHDATLAGTALGVVNNLGYEVGMTAASEGWVAQLPPHVLKDSAALGMIVGLAVGGLDVAISVVGGTAAGARLYNGRCDEQMPASIAKTPPLQRFVDDTLRSTALNVAKNSLRLLAPPLQHAIERDPHGTIDCTLSDRVDVQIDGLGGFLAHGINQVRRLDPGTYDGRMLLRQDLAAVVRKSRDSWGAAALDVLKGVGQGGKALVKSPVPLAVAATIGGFITTLFAANSTIDRQGTARAQLGNDPVPDDRMHYVTAIEKRASSMGQMGMMTASIPIIAAMTDRIVDHLSTLFTRWSHPEFGRSPGAGESRSTVVTLPPDLDTMHETRL